MTIEEKNNTYKKNCDINLETIKTKRIINKN